jgi:predicted AlkP superfamily phosphohydrolase/phosphomutase
LFASVDWGKTQAYALGLNGIFINRRDREAHGIVEESDSAALKTQIREKLTELKDPKTEAAVVLQVYDGDSIYQGKAKADAPDLVVGYAPGFRASWQTALGGVPIELIEDNKEKWSGDHLIDPSQVPGVLFTNFKPTQPVQHIGEIGTLVSSLLELTSPPNQSDATDGQ